MGATIVRILNNTSRQITYTNPSTSTTLTIPPKPTTTEPNDHIPSSPYTPTPLPPWHPHGGASKRITIAYGQYSPFQLYEHDGSIAVATPNEFGELSETLAVPASGAWVVVVQERSGAAALEFRRDEENFRSSGGFVASGVLQSAAKAVSIVLSAKFL
ncbi:hypothetical protein TWF696_006447 [Orbilia brochopaga]|uniref:Uncharacterized protein n=1 Tax=Orbilia brochopaga TaxID=3140254 RepID=A0AAV9UYQ9_9PEZI